MAEKADETADELKGMAEAAGREEDGGQDDAGLGGSSGSEGAASEAKRQRMQTPSPRPMPYMVQPSPPKFVTFDDLMAAADGVKNMSLAHEIAVDANFKLDKLEPPSKGIEKQVKEIIHKAFWDAFQEKISEDPPDFGHAVVLIEEVKEGLLSILMPQHTRLKAQINEVLDMELIQQKLENDAFNIFYYSDYVIGVMARICAPARDDRIAKLREVKDVVPLFKSIFELLDLMKMDMANFTIQQIRPYIQQQSVEYEKKKFDEFLQKQQEAGIDGLELTRLWLARSFDRLQAGESTPSDTASTSHSQAGESTPSDTASTSQSQAGESTPSDTASTSQSQAGLATPAAILNWAYMELLQWDNNRLFPETLVLDQSRYLELRDKTSLLTLVTSVLLVTYNTVGQSIAGVQQLKVKMKEEVCTLLKDVEQKDLPEALANVGTQVNKDVEEFLKGHGFSMRDEAQQKALLGQIIDLNSSENTIIKLMSKRVISFIQQALFVKHNEPLKVPAGMSVMETELSQICGQFLRLISHNRSVFAKRVISFIQQALFVKHNEPLKVPAGMSVMETELSQICGQFLRLISHNRSVFGQHYATIISSLLKRQQEDLSSTSNT